MKHLLAILAFVAFLVPAWCWPIRSALEGARHDPDTGASYRGKVKISRTGDTYSVFWTIDGQEFLRHRTGGQVRRRPLRDGDRPARTTRRFRSATCQVPPSAWRCISSRPTAAGRACGPMAARAGWRRRTGPVDRSGRHTRHTGRCRCLPVKRRKSSPWPNATG